jgi:hypothetical protein
VGLINQAPTINLDFMNQSLQNQKVGLINQAPTEELNPYRNDQAVGLIDQIPTLRNMKCDKLVKLYADLPRKDIRLLTTTTEAGLMNQTPTIN